MQTRTAIQSGHSFLYHYQPFNDDWIGYLETTLRNRTIYLPAPSAFNDPWDCKPWFDLEALNNAEVRERHIAWFMQHAVNPKKQDAEEMRAKPALLRAMVEQCATDLIARINAEYRVFCLTPSDSNLLMWSHYARNHQGICLQFDTRAEPILGAFQVSYQEELPLSTPSEHDGDSATKALLTKSAVWAYEQEFRIIAKEPSETSVAWPEARDHVLKIADNALARVIVGCECKLADQVVDLVQRHQPSVGVRQAFRHPHRYGIGFRTLYEGRPQN